MRGRSHPAHRLPSPYEAGSGLVMIQPWLLLAWIEQSVELIRVLDCTAFEECVHPYAK